MKSRGFTLIELLVVISVISFLATAAIAALNLARIKSRDASRKASVRQIRRALELYYDANNAYPSTSGGVKCLGLASGQTCGNGNVSGSDSLNAALLPFLKGIPLDPLYGKRARGDAFLYGDAASNTAWHCTGTSYPTGPFIFWLADSARATSESDCQDMGFYTCCGSLPCAESYYCAWKVE